MTYSVAKRATVRPSVWPALTGGFVGTLGDFIYGAFVECAHLRDSDTPIVGIRDQQDAPPSRK